MIAKYQCTIAHCAFFSAAFILLACPAAAAPINYGDFSDIPPGSVMYLDVTETANSPGDSEPLFGAPTITGNKLDFDPAAFTAVATNGLSDVTDGQLNMTIMSATVDSGLEVIRITEGGDYSLLGTGTAATLVDYAVGLGAVTVLELDGIPLASPIALALASVSGSDNLGNGTDSVAPWSLSLDYNVDTALRQAGVSFDIGATKIEVAINNVLTAISEPQSVARIAKKDFMIEIVPEPTSLMLLGIALCGLGRFRNR